MKRRVVAGLQLVRVPCGEIRKTQLAWLRGGPAL